MKNAEKLIEKYKKGTCSPDEKLMLENWFHHLGENDQSEFTEDELIEARGRLHTNMLKLTQKSSSNNVSKIQLAAAAILLTITTSIYFYLQNRPVTLTKVVDETIHDIQPGSNIATLTLSNGKKISLSDFENGEIAEQQGIKIIKSSDGQLVYTLSNSQVTSESTAYNTIETPMGGQYQINLPDGSKVWLNSGSSLRYPVKFNSRERKIEISGEAYFEVEKRAGIPFKVYVGGQEIEVLGTHFNVMAYSDEASINTTLIEGSVKIISGKTSKIIKPGQQSRLKNGGIEIHNVDLEEVTAWKEGFFLFKNENILNIMRKISRWYNVEIVYHGNLSDKSFGGKISRSRNISEVLNILESTGSIHFEVITESSKSNGRRVIVMP